MSSDEIINKFNLLYNNKYDYSLNSEFGLYDKITIYCPIHGYFKQIANGHLLGLSCKKCETKKEKISLSKKDKFIKKANTLYNNKYDYSNINYIDVNTKIKIICPVHGEFYDTPNNHIQRNGCKLCNKEKKQESQNNFESFVEKANLVHNKKYFYDKAKYVNARNKIVITCPIHGDFNQIPDNHVSKGYGCPKCGTIYNKCEKEISDFIQSLGFKIILNNRQILNGREIDVFIPSLNIGIEYNGLYWHSELYRSKEYHIEKTNISELNNIKLIHIFEDEWIFKKDIVKSRLKNIFELSTDRIYARKCIIKEVSHDESKMFIENNHIQGYCNSKINIGLYYNNELVSLMTFGFLRKNLGYNNEDNKYELLRFCNKLNTNIVGGASKLLKYFIKVYDPREIISYADRRWSQGKLYEKLGFTFSHNSKCNYFYVINGVRKNRFSFRKDVLVKQGYDKTKSEHQIMLERGIYRIYDCGSKKYILNLK